MRHWYSISNGIKKYNKIDDSGVSTTVEYLMISGVLMTLMIITLLSINTFFVDQPINRVTDVAFVDIANGVSTRIVDMYIIAPAYGNINSNFDLPDDVAGRSYAVLIEGNNESETVTVERGGISHSSSLSGIGATMGVSGNTTGAGLNKLSYYSDR